MNNNIIITGYTPDHQTGIADLLDGIQAEFTESIYARSTPGREVLLPPVTYWVALQDGVVVGTAGIAALAYGNAMLKGMMVQQEQRGTGLAARLLDAVLGYAATMGAEQLYLGTMTQFKAAQRFYNKHGFRRITMQELPADFIINPVDDVFFSLALH